MTSRLPPECVCDPRHRCFVALDVGAVAACLSDFCIRATGILYVSIRAGCLLMV